MKKKFPRPTHYRVRNPEKYIGDVNNVIVRSSWERKFCIWADMNRNVLKWASEETVVPYISPVDNRPHRYFVDFMIQVRNKFGEMKTYAIEIKPSSQTLPPTGKRNTKRLLEEHATYAVNQAKWEAADAFFKRKGIEFLVLTEKELGIK